MDLQRHFFGVPRLAEIFMVFIEFFDEDHMSFFVFFSGRTVVCLKTFFLAPKMPTSIKT